MSLLAAAILLQSPYLQRVATPIRKDSDLAAVAKAIGNARVVQLGELTHGDGTSFEVKTRLVRYLHRELGFDVLVWESGLYECEEMSRRLATAEPIDSVARIGVFGHWSRAEESIGVFRYARETAGSDRPLRMSGFDIQASTRFGMEAPLRVAKQLRELPDLAGVQALTAAIQAVETATTPAMEEERLLALGERVQSIWNRNRSRLKAKFSRDEFDLLNQTVKGFGSYAAMMASYRRFQKSQSPVEMAWGYNLREKANAENLIWLVNHRFRGKKILVWAHNAHVCSFGADGNYRPSTPGDAVLDSSGRILKRALGKQVYSIGFVASKGKWSWLGNPPGEFTRPPLGGIENRFAALDGDLQFGDLVGANSAPDDPVNRPMPGFMNRQNGSAISILWPRAFDGLIYVRDMKPRTQMAETAK